MGSRGSRRSSSAAIPLALHITAHQITAALSQDEIEIAIGVKRLKEASSTFSHCYHSPEDRWASGLELAQSIARIYVSISGTSVILVLPKNAPNNVRLWHGTARKCVPHDYAPPLSSYRSFEWPAGCICINLLLIDAGDRLWPFIFCSYFSFLDRLDARWWHIVESLRAIFSSKKFWYMPWGDGIKRQYNSRDFKERSAIAKCRPNWGV